MKAVNICGGCASHVYCDLVTYMYIRVALNFPKISSKVLSFAVFLSVKESALFCKKLEEMFPFNLHVYVSFFTKLTFRRLMSYIYIYGAPILDVSRSHNDVAQSVGLLWTSDQLVAETST